MNENRPLISIIILNYNAGKLLEECIDSVSKTTYENFQIILVDNKSQDKSHLLCKEKFSNIILIQNDENLGYCEGNNVGIRHADGKFVAILNPDTIVEPSWLTELYEAYLRHGDGLYQPKLLTTSNKNIINTSGNMINIFGFGYSRGKGRQDSDEYNQEEAIGYASGACLFTSTKVLEEIGLFDPFIFAYHDDLDLGWRAAQMGIKSWYIPKAIVYHAESFSFKWSKKKFYLLERNRIYCLLTHYSKNTRYRILPGIIAVELLIITYYLSRGMIQEKFQGYFELLKNHKTINKKYNEIKSKKKISDREVVKMFTDIIEVPPEVANSFFSRTFNRILYSLSRIARLIT